MCKRYSKSVYQYSCQRILSIDRETKEADIQTERYIEDEE